MTEPRHTTEPSVEGEELNGGESLVRPFTLTGGRTRVDGVPLAVHTVIYRSTRVSPGTPPGLGPVEAEIWSTVDERKSVAEIAAHVGLPVGVARVLIGDLLVAGLVKAGTTASRGDAQLVRRLIDGVRSL